MTAHRFLRTRSRRPHAHPVRLRTVARTALLGLVAGGLWAQAAEGAADLAGTSLPKPSAQPPAVVADWLGRNTNIAPQSVVSIGDEYIVAILSSLTLDAASPQLRRLEIRAELTDSDSQTASLLRSLSATLDVNCADHTSHFIEVRTFTGPNLTGAEQVSHPAEGWVADPPGSYFQDINAAVCAPNTPRPLSATLASAGRTVQPQTKRPRPPGQSVAASLRPALSADAAPPRLTAATARGGAQAQIVAAPSQTQAEAALAALRGAQPGLMNGLETRIERIERDGKAYYRALVFGFAPPADASSFCRQLTAAGRGCIIR